MSNPIYVPYWFNDETLKILKAQPLPSLQGSTEDEKRIEFPKGQIKFLYKTQGEWFESYDEACGHIHNESLKFQAIMETIIEKTKTLTLEVEVVA